MKPSPLAYRPAAPAVRGAFTLVELLTVIAIIAILTAIILPAFAAVRESSRRGACISNMQKLQAAVKQYQLDNRSYPEYLLGPAVDATGTPLTGAGVATPLNQLSGDLGAQIGATTPAADITRIKNTKRNFARSLYPEYINDLTSFHCPNNTDADAATDNKTVVVQRYTTPTNTSNYATATAPQAFYQYDSYDANPGFDAANKLTSTFYNRYARQWQNNLTQAQVSALSPTNQAIYRNQLYFRSPSSDTYLTMCTYHAPKGKVIVLWLGGSAKVYDLNKLRNSAIVNPPSSGNDYDLYKLGPTD